MVEQRIYDLLPTELNKVIGDLPGGVRNVVAIVLFDGPGNLEYFGRDTVYCPMIKIVVRNENYGAGQSQVELIKDTLHKHSDDYFLSIMLVGYPMYLGRGEQNLPEFQLTFNIRLKE